MKKRILGLTVAALFCLGQAAFAQEVVVEGNGSDEASAVRDASRNAVEQVLGAQIRSTTQVNSNVVTKDQIDTSSQGYVNHIDILERSTSGGVVHVRARVDVETDPAARQLNKLMRHPTVGILPFQNKGIVSKEWNREDMNQVTGFVQNYIQDLPFNPLERENTKALDDEAALRTSGRVDTVSDIQTGRMRGAQYLLLGSIMGVTARRSETSVAGAGTKRYQVTAMVSMRLVDTETSEVVLASVGRGVSKNTVARAPLNLIRIGTAELEGEQVLAALEAAVRDAMTGPRGLKARLDAKKQGK